MDSARKLQQKLTEELQLAQRHIYARDRIIEGAHAHMVVQNMHLDKLNHPLQTKEAQARKNTDCLRLFPAGHGHYITNTGFIETLEAEKAQWQEEAAAKVQHQVQAARKKVEQAAAEVQWRSICATHTLALELWTAEISQLKAAGVKKRDLPKRPKRPLKHS